KISNMSLNVQDISYDGKETTISSSDESDQLKNEHVEAVYIISLTSIKRVDLAVLLILFLGLLVFQLDRMNLASALTGGFAKDISINQNTVNLGNQLMFMGIVVFEIPCNMVLYRVGPRKWIAGQVFIFGLTATLQVFVKNRAGFLASRLFLGLTEAGYIPGALYTLSTWYTPEELAKKIAIFFFGMFGGNAISPLLASGILKLHAAQGLKGWQWLFLLEGLFTIIISFVTVLCLPESIQRTKSLLGPGVLRLSSEEKDVLTQATQPSIASDEGEDPNRIDWKVVWKVVSHYQRWPTLISAFCVFSTWSPLTTYTPSIIMHLGFDRTSANALAAIGALLALVVVFFFAYISDRTKLRGGTVITAQLCYLTVVIIAHQVHPHVGKWSRWGLWTLVNSFAVGYHPVSNTWLQLNCPNRKERSIGISMWVMSSISGLMVGTQYFRPGDTPL
ncbi:hypothetical protein Golomagni_06867, partial [Golovinomyces magnicellulatus]